MSQFYLISKHSGGGVNPLPATKKVFLVKRQNLYYVEIYSFGTVLRVLDYSIFLHTYRKKSAK